MIERRRNARRRTFETAGFLAHDSGAATVEYAFIIAGISLAILAGLEALSPQFRSALQGALTNLGGPGPEISGPKNSFH